MEKGIRIVESGRREGMFLVAEFVIRFEGAVAGVGRVMVIGNDRGVWGDVFLVGDGMAGKGELHAENSTWTGLAIKSPKSSLNEVVIDCKVGLCLATIAVVFGKFPAPNRGNVGRTPELGLLVIGLLAIEAEILLSLVGGGWVDIDSDPLNTFALSCNARDGTVGAFTEEFEASAKSPKSSSTSSCCEICGGFLAQNADGGFVLTGKVFAARAANGSLSELGLFIPW